MHSNLTRWIEDADARQVLLEGAEAHHPQGRPQRDHIHLGPSVDAAISWWHHKIAGHLFWRPEDRSVSAPGSATGVAVCSAGQPRRQPLHRCPIVFAAREQTSAAIERHLDCRMPRQRLHPLRREALFDR